VTLLVGRQEGHPACKKTEWWGAGVVICLERGTDLHMAQLMPRPLTVSCFSKIQIGFTFLVPAHPRSPGKRAVKRVCVCVRASTGGVGTAAVAGAVFYHTHAMCCYSRSAAAAACSARGRGNVVGLTLILNRGQFPLVTFTPHADICVGKRRPGRALSTGHSRCAVGHFDTVLATCFCPCR